MRKPLIKNVHSLTLRRSVDGSKQPAEKFFALEKHPRQKEQIYPPIIVTPLMFM